MLRIAYLSDMPPDNPLPYSGGNARMFDALSRHAGHVEPLSQDWGAAEPLRRAIRAAPDRLSLRLRWRAHYALRRVIARRVARAVAQGGFDVLFGAYALHAMAGVRVPAGVVTAFTSDAVQTVYRTSEVGSAFARALPLGGMLDAWVERREREALGRLDVALWPSEWLRQAVDARYGLARGVGQLVPWGANVPWVDAPPPKTLDPQDAVRLLVIGRDWWAKGGPLAFATCEALRAQGVDARLAVIGCTPPEMHRGGFVEVLGPLDKSVPAEMARFAGALQRAHFLVQPSFESYGFAFCEASAYGLPSLCLAVGGVPVREGVNGHALLKGAQAGDFAALIQQYCAAPDRYAALSASSRREYEERLNWDAWGRTVAALLEEAVEARRRAR